MTRMSNQPRDGWLTLTTEEEHWFTRGFASSELVEAKRRRQTRFSAGSSQPRSRLRGRFRPSMQPRVPSSMTDTMLALSGAPAQICWLSGGDYG